MANLKSNKSDFSKLIKPSELPIYEEIKDNIKTDYNEYKTSALEENISLVRKEIEKVYHSTDETREQISHVYNTGLSHTLGTLSYLNEEENLAARVGAISLAGFCGVLFAGRKKGFLKRIFYASLGSGGTAAAFYPKESTALAYDLYENASVYSNVAYKFIVGAKPQNESIVNVNSNEKKLTQKSDDQKNSKPQEPLPSLVRASQTELPAKKNSIIGDFGQANPADKDMYTTRS